MVQGRIALAIASGIDDPEHPLGTDAVQVQQAIESIFHQAGVDAEAMRVLVLMDLGSALMSAEMALEFLPDHQRRRVYLCEAPLVEGTIAAAVAAAAGHSIEQAIAEARGSLVAKAAQLGIEVPHAIGMATPVATSPESSPESSRESIAREIHVTLQNSAGLHARPAAQFVATAARFQAQIQIRNATRGTDAVRADSLNQVALLAARQGHELVITAIGADADAALAELHRLVSNFGAEETDIEPAIATPLPTHSAAERAARPAGQWSGIPASPGIAIAPLMHYRPAQATAVPNHTQSGPDSQVHLQAAPQIDPQTEWQRLQAAIQAACQDIQELRSRTALHVGSPQAAIFDAHQLLLEDPVLNEAARQHVMEQHMAAEPAWQGAVDELVIAYCSLNDAYLQARAADVIDVGHRVLRHLAGTIAPVLTLTQPTILVADDLTPSDTAQLDPVHVLGLCTAKGSTASHTAILARALGIPAVVGLGAQILHWRDGTPLALDGETGQVWLDPPSDLVSTLHSRREAGTTIQQQAQAIAHYPAVTRDGRHIPVLANIGHMSDARMALELGADGVGLLRTEFLYLDRTSPPSEAEQFAIYQAIAQTLGTRSLIIRTFDMGGDKPLPYLNHPPESNPFLGDRGIRLCLTHSGLFKTQLRAILRASPDHAIKLMFPMIATLSELRAAKAMLNEVQTELHQAGIAFDPAMPIGMMVEVPSAVAIADQLAANVDFFSLGTNDLSQYVMAADRTNPQVAHLANALHPAVLRLMQQTIQAGHQAGIWVGLCGELASDPAVAPLLLGLGLDEISLSPHAIPRLKQTIAQLTVAEAEVITAAALSQDSVEDVKAIISQYLF
jgi:phosphocarrier protein FPr